MSALEDIPDDAVRVLDHGYVRLLACSASDLDVVNAARASFKASQSSVDRRAEGLIAFLMRERHGTPFEHNFFKFEIRAPIFVNREWFRHRVACLAGDTFITCESGRNHDGSVRTAYKRTIKEIYYTKHGWPEIKRGWQPYRSDRRGLRVLNEESGFYETGQMREVWDSGTKELYGVCTANGMVKASADHPFLTTEGWVKVKDLEKGMLLIGSKNVSASPGVQVPPSLRRGIGVWTSMQRSALIGEGRRCGECGEFFSKDDLQLDHRIPVISDLTLALDIKNLIPLCIKCHRVKSDGEQSLATRRQRLGKKEIALLSKPTSVSEEPTFDIEVEGPWHNYVANGLVVHNSYNEESGRYSEIHPIFYSPRTRVRTQVGKPGAYTFERVAPVEDEKWSKMIEDHNTESYLLYKKMLEAGVAREVARMILPLTTFSTFIFSCNARSLMNFLSLRNAPDAQEEIRMYASALEIYLAREMPVVHREFVIGGRRSP